MSTRMSPSELRAHVEEAPTPLDGPALYDRFSSEPEKGYDMAGRAAAKAMLLVCTEDPALLSFPEGATSTDKAFRDAPWKAAEARWPGLDDWLGGITGFQFGWANNAVRYILGAESVGNPALVTLS